MDKHTYDCIIIGGGMSGISFAHYLSQEGKKILVLEKNKQVGGQVQSPVSQSEPNYWRELGAHTCYNSYTHLLSIVKTLGQEKEVHNLGKGSYMVYANGKVRSPMTQINYPSLILSGMRLFFSTREEKTVKEYFQHIVGKKNYEHLFTRLFRAVLSQDTDDYPAEMFLKKRDGRYDEFPRKYTFYKGMHHIIDLMISENHMDVNTEQELMKIDYHKEYKQYTLTTKSGQTYQTKTIALASDPQSSSLLVADLEPQLTTLLQSIPMFHSESMNVIVEKDKMKLKNVAGIIPVSDEFHSAVSRDLVEDKKLRSFTFHFAKGKHSYESKQKLIGDVLDIDTKDFLEISEDRHILPSLRIQHLHMAEQVTKVQKDKNIYMIGNYFYGLSLEDCAHRSSDEAKRWIASNQ